LILLQPDGEKTQRAGVVCSAFWVFSVNQMVFKTSLRSLPLILCPFRRIVSLSRACLAVLDLWKYVLLSLFHIP